MQSLSFKITLYFNFTFLLTDHLSSFLFRKLLTFERGKISKILSELTENNKTRNFSHLITSYITV